MSAPNTSDVWGAHWRANTDAYLRDPLWVSTVMDRAKLESLSVLLPRKGTIVEFGCGSGRLLRFAIARGLTGVGVDYSVDALRVLKKHAVNDGIDDSRLLPIQGDVRDTGLPSNSVDVVASTGLLEHFTDADVEKIVTEMTRVLKPGGLFYSDIVPAKFSLYRSLQQATRRKPEVWERYFSKRDIVRVLESAGLESVEVFGAGVFPPIIPLLERFEAVRSTLGAFAHATQRFWKMWDRTAVGDFLGFYYFATGRKPQTVR